MFSKTHTSFVHMNATIVSGGTFFVLFFFSVPHTNYSPELAFQGNPLRAHFYVAARSHQEALRFFTVLNHIFTMLNSFNFMLFSHYPMLLLMLT